MPFAVAWDETVPTDIEVCGQGASRLRELKAGFLERLADNRPLGAVINWPADTVPTNWLECDGSAISRSTYSALFAVYGTRFGRGDGTSTFNIPDLRGLFTRGHNNGRTGQFADADAATRHIKKTGTATSGSAVITGINGTDGLAVNDAIAVVTSYGDVASGSAVITNMMYQRRTKAGMAISGTGIPAGATVLSVDSATQITLSAPATVSTKMATLTMTPTGASTHINSVDSESQVTLHDASTITGTVTLYFVVGDEMNSEQDDENQAHRHFRVMPQHPTTVSPTSVSIISGSLQDQAHFDATDVFKGVSGLEFRPENICMKKIIKASAPG
jgi:hypothetical protein